MSEQTFNFMFEGNSQYEIAANAFTVKDIASPAIAIPPEAGLDKARDIMFDDHDEIIELSVVKDEDAVYGYLDLYGGKYFDKMDPGLKAKDVAEPILTYQTIASNATILQLIQQLTEEPFMFVIDNNTVSQMIYSSDLDKFPVRLCIFALLMGLDDILLNVLKNDEDIEEYYSKLPDKARDRIDAIAINHSRFETHDVFDKLECTNFNDKHRLIKMLLKDIDPTVGAYSINQMFYQITRVRNLIAHGQTLRAELSSPKDYANFLKILKLFYEYFRTYLPNS